MSTTSPLHLRISSSQLAIAAAFLARLALARYTALPRLLQDRQELSTPLSNTEHLKEGVYLWQRGLNPYEGSSFHLSPIYLILSSSLPSFLDSIIWPLADLVSAFALAKIWDSRWREDKVRRHVGDVGGRLGDGEIRSKRWLKKWGKEWKWNAMLLYLLNPYTILTCLSRSTTTLNNALILLSVMFAANDNIPMTLYFLSIISFIDLYPILLLPPLILLLRRKSTCSTISQGGMKEIGSILVGWACFFLVWIGLTWFALRDWKWISRTWMTILTVSDLTPNVGLWWYFFTEMFDHFRRFFMGVFQLHLVIYIAPLCIRLQNQPLLATTIMLGIISMFKSYPTLGEASLFMGLIGVFPDLWAELRHPLLTATLHLYTLILLPLLNDLWLVSGTGNANFFYAATLVYGLGGGMAVVDMLTAGMRVECGRKVLMMMAEEKREVGEVEREIENELTLEDVGLTIVQYTTL